MSFCRRAAGSSFVAATLFCVIGSCGFAQSQEITGTPGASNATTTIDGHVLPPPPPKFGGDIELNAAQ